MINADGDVSVLHRFIHGHVLAIINGYAGNGFCELLRMRLLAFPVINGYADSGFCELLRMRFVAKQSDPGVEA